MLPDLQLELPTENLVPLTASASFDVPLFWQQWRLASTALDRVAAAITEAADALSSRSVGARSHSQPHR